jgi:hypothetical protein
MLQARRDRTLQLAASNVDLPLQVARRPKGRELVQTIAARASPRTGRGAPSNSRQDASSNSALFSHDAASATGVSEKEECLETNEEQGEAYFSLKTSKVLNSFARARDISDEVDVGVEAQYSIKKTKTI